MCFTCFPVECADPQYSTIKLKKGQKKSKAIICFAYRGNRRKLMMIVEILVIMSAIIISINIKHWLLTTDVQQYQDIKKYISCYQSIYEDGKRDMVCTFIYGSLAMLRTSIVFTYSLLIMNLFVVVIVFSTLNTSVEMLKVLIIGIIMRILNVVVVYMYTKHKLLHVEQLAIDYLDSNEFKKHYIYENSTYSMMTTEEKEDFFELCYEHYKFVLYHLKSKK